MKRTAIALSALVILTANAQLTNSPPPVAEESLQTELAERAKEATLEVKEQKPNEISAGTVTYSGILIEAVKVDHPLELLNPAAPVEYGSPEDNVVRDSVTKKVSGLKLFSIDF
jgi:hypothetical protein